MSWHDRMWLLWADEVTSADNKGVWATAAGRALRRTWVRDVAILQRNPDETDDEYEARRALLLLEWTPAEVVIDPSVMDGMPVVKGTRIPAETILDHLRSGGNHRDLFDDYPTLPLDGIDAVIRWADETIGPDWRQPRERK